jgi:hypothetical protein
MKKPANVVESKQQQQAEVAAAQVVMAKAAKVRAEQALEQDDVAVQAAVEATSEEAQVQAAVAEDTGSATLADAAFVLGEAGAAVQSNSLFSSPLAYVGGAFGSSLIGGAGSAASVGASALSSAAAGAASVASVDDERVSIVSVESSDEAADASADDTPAPVFAPVVEQAPVAASDVSMGQIATVDNSEADAGVAQRARLKIDGVMDNSGTMRVMYGDGAALGDTTPVITGVAAANQRIVIRDKASNTTLGLTTSDANGNWSFELPTRSSGQHEVTVQTISMDREEASFAFRVSEASGATASTASNALVAATGTEDTAYVFGATDIANLRSGTNINIITEILVNSLPADGVLQFRANNTWTPVTVGQSISNADIRGGNLRFVPDANESGSSAYNNAGVGNQRNLYTEFDLKVVGASAATSEGDVTFQLSITPVVDNTQTMTAAVARVGSIAALGAGTWGRYTFAVTGTINDTDGSERTRIEITPANRNTTFAVLTGTTYTTVTPDAAGKIFLNPGQTLFVREYSIGGMPGTSLQHKLIGEEINAAGNVLATKDLTSARALQAVQPPPPPVDPLILDLDGNGVRTTTVDDGVAFDFLGTGEAIQVAWTDGKDGFLVLDRNGDGQITTGAEMFGDYTPMSNGAIAKDGFEALRDLDSNADGLFNAQDELFDLVQVWVDANSDGVSEAGELKGLKELGVQSIRLNPETSDRVENGNLYGLISTMTLDNGGTAEVVDVWLSAKALEINTSASTII